MRLYRNETVMWALTTVSALCVTFEFLGWACAGSPLPQTQWAGEAEKLAIWIVWIAIIALPAFTAVLWLLRLAARERR
jgi:hypothetical protein